MGWDSLSASPKLISNDLWWVTGGVTHAQKISGTGMDLKNNFITRSTDLSSRSIRQHQNDYLVAPIMRSLQILGDVGAGSHGTHSITLSRAYMEWVREVLINGLFLLPHGCFYILPCPRQRFCVNLGLTDSEMAECDECRAAVSFGGSRKFRKAAKKFRLAVNSDFASSLRIGALFHKLRSSDTWINEEVVQSLDIFAEGTRRRAQPPRESQGEREATQEDRDVALGSYETVLSLDPLINMYSFELYDAATGELCALVFTYCIGSVASDFTAATLRRDKHSCGKLLTRVVGDILRRTGIKLWYWGYQADYMKDFRPFGGGNIAGPQFYELWDKYLRTPSSHSPSEMEKLIKSGECLVQPTTPVHLPRTIKQIFVEDWLKKLDHLNEASRRIV